MSLISVFFKLNNYEIYYLKIGNTSKSNSFSEHFREIIWTVLGLVGSLTELKTIFICCVLTETEVISLLSFHIQWYYLGE